MALAARRAAAALGNIVISVCHGGIIEA